jgi:hypothetical protein
MAPTGFRTAAGNERSFEDVSSDFRTVEASHRIMNPFCLAMPGPSLFHRTTTMPAVLPALRPTMLFMAVRAIQARSDAALNVSSPGA